MTLQGTRLPDGTEPTRPGEYAWMPYDGWDHKPSFLLGDGEWHLCDPTGRCGAIGRSTRQEPVPAHTVTIHDDTSITCSPSLVMPSGWHGFLVHGVWQ